MLSTFILAVESIFNPFMGFHFWGMTTEQLDHSARAARRIIRTLVVLEPLTRRFEKKWLLDVRSAQIININAPIVLAFMCLGCPKKEAMLC